MKNRGFTSGLLVCLVAVAAGTGLLFVLSLSLQEGLHLSPRDTSLGLVPLTLGLVAAGFAAMGGLVAELGRRLVFIGLTVDLVGCGWVLVLVADSGTNVSLRALAPAFFVIGVGIGLSFATIPTVALGDAKPAEAGSASGSFSSIQQVASAIGSAAVTSIFFQAATSGTAHAMEVTLPRLTWPNPSVGRPRRLADHHRQPQGRRPDPMRREDRRLEAREQLRRHEPTSTNSATRHLLNGPARNCGQPARPAPGAPTHTVTS
jgi:MFS family permease